jgi:hypothetical protein
MPYTNTFFSNTTGYEAEVNLLDDLVIEQININGVDILFLPRKLVNYDDFLNDATKSAFEIGLPIPMYIKNYSGYNNGMELLTKFGVSNTEELTLVVSKSLFTTHYSPFLKAYYQSHSNLNPEDPLNPLKGETAFRPKEGDLIFFPFDNSLFEIKYVTPDDPFFQFGKGYTYELQTEKFTFSGEVFDTGIEEVDRIQKPTSYYKVSFDLRPNSQGTFLSDENVKIYHINQINPAIFPTPPPEIIDFSFYDNESIMKDVPFVTAKVFAWSKPQLKLVVGNLSDQDPTQPDSDQDMTIDPMENVMIVGEQSGAIYFSYNADVMDTPFDDRDTIQPEFDSIKIVDSDDEFEFGFY